MRSKSIYLLLSCVCGTVAAVLASEWLKAQGNQNTTSMVEIFVTTSSIDVGEKITGEKIALERWPADKVPEGTSQKLVEVEGKYAKQRLYEDEPIILAKLMDENWTSVPNGWKAVDMDASELGISSSLQPGDRVDVVGFFEKGDFIPRSESHTVFMGIRVFSIDGDTSRRTDAERGKPARYLQLLIPEKDKDAWSYAKELADIELHKASDQDHTLEDGSNEAAADFLAMIENHRKELEAEEERLRLEQEEAARQELEAEVTVEPAITEEKVEGFTMFKLVAGRMLEYRIVAGKLPVLIGEVGTNDREPQNSPTSVLPGKVQQDHDYRRPNGKDSPFFQPPSNVEN
ncbi:MAG TPA: Flp pilus assembly protein CpaB [Rhodopirellula sp.]|nr:MAG: Flp pilus assembly protein CpaB [Saprospirales bacterium TMED214]HBV63800.1 Flp pilus assembly protein CpaB [Rhodopirellula sp.]